MTEHQLQDRLDLIDRPKVMAQKLRAALDADYLSVSNLQIVVQEATTFTSFPEVAAMTRIAAFLVSALKQLESVRAQLNLELFSHSKCQGCGVFELRGLLSEGCASSLALLNVSHITSPPFLFCIFPDFGQCSKSPHTAFGWSSGRRYLS